MVAAAAAVLVMVAPGPWLYAVARLLVDPGGGLRPARGRARRRWPDGPAGRSAFTVLVAAAFLYGRSCCPALPRCGWSGRRGAAAPQAAGGSDCGGGDGGRFGAGDGPRRGRLAGLPAALHRSHRQALLATRPEFGGVLDLGLVKGLVAPAVMAADASSAGQRAMAASPASTAVRPPAWLHQCCGLDVAQPLDQAQVEDAAEILVESREVLVGVSDEGPQEGLPAALAWASPAPKRPPSPPPQSLRQQPAARPHRRRPTSHSAARPGSRIGRTGRLRPPAP